MDLFNLSGICLDDIGKPEEDHDLEGDEMELIHG